MQSPDVVHGQTLEETSRTELVSESGHWSIKEQDLRALKASHDDHCARRPDLSVQGARQTLTTACE